MNGAHSRMVDRQGCPAIQSAGHGLGDERMTEEETVEQVLQELTRRAQKQWGEARAAELAGPLEDTARQVWEVRCAAPDAEVEPGFYQ